MKRRTHKWAFPVGTAIIGLAIVGTISIVSVASREIKLKLENPREKIRYEEFLANIIEHDPDPFDSPDGVPEKNLPQLLDIAIWAILKDASPEVVAEEDGELLIRQELVEQEYEKIFGTKPKKHLSIEGSDFDFLYDADEQVYRVPTTGSLSIYTPRVTDIKKKGNSVELTVDCLAYGDFEIDSRGRPVTPVKAAKILMITLYEQENGNLQVGSIHRKGGSDVLPGEILMK